MLINLLIEIDNDTSLIGSTFVKFNNNFEITILKGNTILIRNSSSFNCYIIKKEILINSKVLELISSGDQYQCIMALKLIENKAKIKLLNE